MCAKGSFGSENKRKNTCATYILLLVVKNVETCSQHRIVCFIRRKAELRPARLSTEVDYSRERAIIAGGPAIFFFFCTSVKDRSMN